MGMCVSVSSTHCIPKLRTFMIGSSATGPGSSTCTSDHQFRELPKILQSLAHILLAMISLSEGSRNDALIGGRVLVDTATQNIVHPELVQTPCHAMSSLGLSTGRGQQPTGWAGTTRIWRTSRWPQFFNKPQSQTEEEGLRIFVFSRSVGLHSRVFSCSKLGEEAF